MMSNEITNNGTNVIGFFHTYAQDGELDPYMMQLAQAFSEIGVRLHLILANDVVTSLDYKYYRPGISQSKLIEYINAVKPAFIFSTNRCGITQAIMRDTECKIITCMVDLMPFYHQGGEDKPLFCKRDILITPTTNSVSLWKESYPVLENRVHYAPFATNPEDFKNSDSCTKDCNIVFVGTHFYTHTIIKLLEKYQDNIEVYQSLLSLINYLKDDYDHDFNALLHEVDLVEILDKLHIGADELKMSIANLISLNDRTKYLDSVSDLGLSLYGTSNWIQVGQYSTNLLKCFQAGKYIKTREQLIGLYERSKIALNVSHIQAVNGLPYRILDVMASSALLVTEYNKNSDLFKIFGSDVPVPMYKNEQELREIVKYYLEHDDERLAIVEKCNKLVLESGVTFKDRVKEYFSIAGVEIFPGKGEVLRVDVEREFGVTPNSNNDKTNSFEVLKHNFRKLFMKLRETICRLCKNA